MATIEINGAQLYYEDRGQGVALLFIHESAAGANSWDGLIERLPPEFRTVTFDRRGNRRSSAGALAERSVQTDAQDTAALIRGLDLAPCVVVGLSWGGAVALEVMRRHGGLLSGAVLGEPTLPALNPEGAAELFADLMPSFERAEVGRGPRAAVDVFYRMVAPSFWSSLSEEDRERYRANYAGLKADLEMPQYAVGEADLRAVDSPSLVLIGTESAGFFHRIARTLAREMPAARLVEVEGAGHAVFHERPDFCAGALAEFCQRFSAV